MNSVVLWKGVSRIDKNPIVFIATGVNGDSKNEKTGKMVQTWILREDMSPIDAIHTNNDFTICGHCPARGNKGKGRYCYVRYDQAPQSVWQAYKHRRYGEYIDTPLVFNHPIRLGSYGDPTAIPFDILDRLMCGHRYTGYTSQWINNQEYQKYCMASVSSEKDRLNAKRLGWRTYRIRKIGQPLMDGEIQCPSDRVQCNKCLLCCGTSRRSKDISIEVHGTNNIVKNFNENQ